jgi:hypothetical protein
MVKDKTPQPAPRAPRRSWPFFGWATAVAALLLVFVVAGDVFLVAPPDRPAMKEAAVEIAPEMEQEALSVAQAPTRVPDAVPEVPDEAEEAEAPMAMVAQTPPGEETVPAEKAAPEESVPAEEADLPSPAAAMGGGGEPPAEPEMSEATVPQEETPAAEATPATEAAPADEPITATVQVEKQVVGTPEPGTEIPRVAARPTLEKTDAGDEGPHPLQEQAERASAEAQAAAEADEGVSVWLRLAEGGLALLVVALAVTTWVIRRREV